MPLSQKVESHGGLHSWHMSSSSCHLFVQAGSFTWASNLSPPHELLPPASLCKHGSLRLTLPLRRAPPPEQFSGRRSNHVGSRIKEMLRPRGGWRQRAAAHGREGRSRSPRRGARDFEGLPRQIGLFLRDWARGDLPAERVLEYAREHPAAAGEHAFLAGLRRCPLAEGNAKRFLLNRFRPPHHLLQELPLTDPVHVWIPPAALFSYVYEHFPEMFVTMFGANRAELARFWRGLRGGSRNGLRLAQALDIEDESATVPITVHLDGMPVSKRTSCKLLQFAGLLGQGAAEAQCCLVAVWPKGADPGEDFWVRFAAEVDSMAAGPWRARVVFLKADGETLARDYRLLDYNSTYICSHCKASTNEATRWQRWGPEAPWRASTLSHEDFRGAHVDKHPMFSHLRGFGPVGHVGCDARAGFRWSVGTFGWLCFGELDSAT